VGENKTETEIERGEERHKGKNKTREICNQNLKDTRLDNRGGSVFSSMVADVGRDRGRDGGLVPSLSAFNEVEYIATSVADLFKILRRGCFRPPTPS